MNEEKSKSRDNLQGRTRKVIDNETGTVREENDPEEFVDVKVNRRGALVHDANPFLFAVVRDMQTRKQLRTVSRGTAYLVDKTENKAPLRTTVQEEEEIDSARFVKLFSGPEYREVYNLTPPGLKMYCVVLEVLGDVSHISKDFIRLTTQMACKLTADSDFPVSTSTANRGIKDLIDKEYIAPAEINGEETGWFWINPKRFFQGNTIELKKIYRIAKQNKAKRMEIRHPDVSNMYGDEGGEE